MAILAISSSAVLVRWADTSPVTLAFWRTLGGALILAPAAARERTTISRRHRVGVAVAGIALGLHFVTWLASLGLTSAAASVSLVATAPIMIAVFLAATGRPPARATWVALGVALVGTIIITAGDAAGGALDTSNDALVGDLLALVGAAMMAIYLVVGDGLRAELSTAAYASRTYGVAAATTGIIAVVSGLRLTGYDTTTWLAIGGMILGPQLAGHTALNHLLQRFGSVTVSLALLAEPFGAAALVWLAFRDVPPVAALLGGPVIVAGLAIHLLGSPRPAEPAPDTEEEDTEDEDNDEQIWEITDADLRDWLDG